jgi:hypothetical protein
MTDLPTPAPTTSPPRPDEDAAHLRRARPLGDGARRDDDWLDDLEDDRPRRRVSMVLAVLPWLVVAALLVLPGRFGAGPEREGDDPAGAPATTSSTDEATPAAPSASERNTDATSSGRNAGTTAPREPPPSGGASAADPSAERQLAAIATIVARGWLTDVDPALDVDGLDPARTGSRYVEHLVVESIDAASAEQAVVALLAVVLSGDAWLEVDVLRIAVPLATDASGPRPAGAPWLLPAPALTTVPLDLTPVEDPDLLLAARDALLAAGFADPEVLSVSASGAGVLVVELDDPAAPAVWLHPADDGFRVAGAPAENPATEVAP